ncbi:transcription factor IIIA-like [Pollicipes pollicipes]|uniref:transcription factor IIIA-like n=1 Tax=Pollicipes pollicipes TaxID=41117 RepID=UPI001884D6CA|nr:transcription factor IIIA-like [Pollicipes pollicipes]
MIDAIIKDERPKDAFTCPVEGCDKILKTADTFKKHARSHRRRQHVCGHCDRGFAKRQHLKIHQHEHTGIKPFRCSREGCHREFLLPSKLKAHERQHDKYRCPSDGCGAQLDSWKQLLQHRRQLHSAPREHKCPTCAHTFLSRAALKVHRRVHGETRDIFHCPYEDCPRYYYFKRNLISHTRSSHEGKGFICSVETCKKKLSTQQKLSQHMRLHDGSQPAPRPRRKQRPRRDRGVRRGPQGSLFSHLTGEPVPSGVEAEAAPAPTSTAPLEPAEVERVVAETERLAWRCHAPSRKRPRLAQLEDSVGGGWVEHLVRSCSETESHSDEASHL